VNVNLNVNVNIGLNLNLSRNLNLNLSLDLNLNLLQKSGISREAGSCTSPPKRFAWMRVCYTDEDRSRDGKRDASGKRGRVGVETGGSLVRSSLEYPNQVRHDEEARDAI
jgi:hypothetical protein